MRRFSTSQHACIRDFLLQIGKCRYIMCGTFETGRKGLDASLEAGLEAHSELITSKYPNGGIGSDPFITIGKKQIRFRDFWSDIII